MTFRYAKFGEFPYHDCHQLVRQLDIYSVFPRSVSDCQYRMSNDLGLMIEKSIYGNFMKFGQKMLEFASLIMT
ncbi:unnamed protein product [Allacma fusca]|uniref:Uncharacterized protein n=1 Tax=Allacma fusca TaxID=39272 RepID=A0A8J2PK46_9HEXA|nr:unnamed protein product [Allacma fusca]